MRLRRSGWRLVIVPCLVIFSLGRITFAQSATDDQVQHDNSDATKTKKKLKGAKRAAGKSKHPGFSAFNSDNFQASAPGWYVAGTWALTGADTR
jgi:hypothetical protein